MRNIKVYYHFFIPPDHRAGSWHWWIDQQFGMIKSSGLSDVAEVKMAITMPRFWTEMFGINIYTHSVQNPINFEEKVREYISIRYPFVNIVDVRDVMEPNIYEGQTLDILHKDSQEGDFDICYIQNKGAVSGFTAHVANWRDLLNHYIIKEWTNCVHELETHDLVGVSDRNSNGNLMSGNFWWARSEYIRKLQSPIQSDKYTNDYILYPWGPSYRYAFEHWVTHHLNPSWETKVTPNLKYIVETQVDHYSEYCFLEDFLALQHKIRL